MESETTIEAAMKLLSERPTVDTALKNILSLLLVGHPRHSSREQRREDREDRLAKQRQYQLCIRAISLELNDYRGPASYGLLAAQHMNRSHDKKNTKTLGKSFIVEAWQQVKHRLTGYATRDDDHEAVAHRDAPGSPSAATGTACVDDDSFGSGPLSNVSLSVFYAVVEAVEKELNDVDSVVWKENFLSHMNAAAAERAALAAQRHHDFAVNEAERIWCDETGNGR